MHPHAARHRLLKPACLLFHHLAVICAEGSEPPASWSQTRRSPRLSYAQKLPPAGIEPALRPHEGRRSPGSSAEKNLPSLDRASGGPRTRPLRGGNPTCHLQHLRRRARWYRRELNPGAPLIRRRSSTARLQYRAPRRGIEPLWTYETGRCPRQRTYEAMNQAVEVSNLARPDLESNLRPAPGLHGLGGS